MTLLGGTKKHDALLSVTQNIRDQVGPLLTKLQGIFNEVHFFVLDLVDESGWPKSANNHFVRTAIHIVNNPKLQGPWYWFEVDNTPLVPDWADALEYDHKIHGMPYTGVISDTNMLNTKTMELEQQGKHLTGTAIYPKDFVRRIPLVQKSADVPFDIFIQWYMINPAQNFNLVNDTRLIHHAWQTVDYKFKDGQWSYGFNEKVWRSVKPSGPRVVSPLAKVVHGCKDDSLLDGLISQKQEDLQNFQNLKKTTKEIPDQNLSRNGAEVKDLPTNIGSSPTLKCEIPLSSSPKVKRKLNLVHN